MSAVARSPVQCNYCFQPGHDTRTCPNGGLSTKHVASVANFANRKCSNCGKPGHRSNRCTESSFRDEQTQPYGPEAVDEIVEDYEDAVLQRALYLQLIDRTNKEIARLTRERDNLWIRLTKVKVPR